MSVTVRCGWGQVSLPSADAPKGTVGPSREVLGAVEQIVAKELIADTKVLCDPKFRGREASSPGGRKAAVYLADRFREIGLLPGGNAGSFYQVFKIRVGYRITSHMEFQMGGSLVEDFKRGVDFRTMQLPGGKADLKMPCVLAGYGISSRDLRFDEYAGIDAKGKAAIVFSGVPWSAKAGQWIRRLGDRRYDTLGYKARNAADHGAACLLVVENPAGWRPQVGVPEQLANPDTESPIASPIPVIHVTRSVAARMMDLSLEELRLLALEIGRDLDPGSMALRGKTLTFRASLSGQARIGRNIIGILPGSDEALRKEAVVIGAHYDHLGEGPGEEIYFGANDNAAGVAALLGVAKAFAALPNPPKRTIVFVAFDAEEIGRRGSRSYVEKPAIPIAQTVLMINFDMIGRNASNEINAVGTKSSDELHEIHQRANRWVGMELKHPASFRLGLSDHSTFYYAGVPILYLFGGRDPDYNTPRDTWDKLIPDKVQKVARLAFLTALDVAQRPRRITLNKGSGEAGGWPH